MTPNKYANECGKIGDKYIPNTCHWKVPSMQGMVERIDNQWVVFCPACYAYRHGEIYLGKKKLTSEGRLYFPHETQALSIIRSFPAAEFHWQLGREPYWTVSTDQSDRLRVLELANKLNIEVSSDLQNIEESYIDKDAANAGLYPYQLEGVNWLSKQNRAILGDEMGLGKTIQALMSLEFDDCVLVVAPACVQYNWQNEIENWRPDFQLEVLKDTESFRLPKHGEILIVSYRRLPDWLLSEVGDDYKKLLKKCTIIVDEAHNVGNSDSLRSQKIHKLSRLVQKVWFLTGTPVKNRPLQLYNMLDAGNMVEDTFGTFDSFYHSFNAHKKRIGNKSITQWGEPNEDVEGLLKRVMLRRRRETVLPQLPNVTYQDLIVENSSIRVTKQLNTLWDKWHNLIEDDVLPPFEEFAKVRAEIAKSRIPAMMEYVEQCEFQDVPLVVFSAHRAPIEALSSRSGWGAILGDVSSKERAERVEAFQRGELKGIALTIGSGSEGINLHHAYLGLFVDQDWTPGLNEQAVGRLNRLGQTRKVLISRMVSNHPVERHTHDLLCGKIQQARKILGEVLV